MLSSWRLAVLTSLGLIQGCGVADLAKDDSNLLETGVTDSVLSEALRACVGQEIEIQPGLYQCENGGTHRAEAVRCESSLPREIRHEGGESFQCASDQDCTERDHGYCQLLPRGLLTAEFTKCRYGCVEDSDCGAGMICDCGDPVGTCVSARDCKSDGDCGEGGLCARYSFNDGCFDDVGYACVSEKDECLLDEDCVENRSGCAWTPDGRRCQAAYCVIGRPFLVEGSERLASVERRADWSEANEAEESAFNTYLAGLTLSERVRLGNEWTRIGLMEHASIAAFARFNLQLLSLGAPAHLVEACNQAIVDETLHTQLAFGLASRYTGSPVGPGPLEMNHALSEDGFEAIVLNTVLEGCIGETVAAMEAREALVSTSNHAVRGVLEQIAHDEARHAELAWQFVQWAVAQHPHLAQKVQALVEGELCCPQQVSAGESWLRAHGILSEGERAQLRNDVVKDVVAPCIAALCKAQREPQIRMPNFAASV